MAEDVHIEIRFKAGVEQSMPSSEELALLESILPELIAAMQGFDTSDAE